MKRLTTILILSFLSFGVWAQNAHNDFRLGLTATPTIGWVKPELGKGDGSGLGFSYGIMGDFNFASNYSFATALTITTINGKSIEPNALPYHQEANGSESKDYSLKYKMHYLQIPLTIKLKTDKIADLRWYGQFGLSNDFKIGAKQDASVDGKEIANGRNASDWTRFYRAGLIIGGGAEYDINEKTSIMAGLSFNNGFTKITTNSGNNVRNHYIALNLGVFF